VLFVLYNDRRASANFINYLCVSIYHRKGGIKWKKFVRTVESLSRLKVESEKPSFVAQHAIGLG